MKRRSFLRGAAAVVPAVAVPELFFAQALGQAAAVPGELHVVGSSEDRMGHSHSLGFSTFYFKMTGAETADGSAYVLGCGAGDGAHDDWVLPGGKDGTILPGYGRCECAETQRGVL